MSDANDEQSKDPRLDAEEIRRILKSMDGVGNSDGPSEAAKQRFVLKSNEELRRLTAMDLVDSGKYTSLEEALEDLKKLGF